MIASGWHEAPIKILAPLQVQECHGSTNMQVDALLAASWKDYKQVDNGYCW